MRVPGDVEEALRRLAESSRPLAAGIAAFEEARRENLALLLSRVGG